MSEISKLSADLKGFRKLMKEVDRRHRVEIKGIKRAAKVATKVGERARRELASAQKNYNETHNDRVPRDEAESRFKEVKDHIARVEAMVGASHKELSDKIQALSESRSSASGASAREAVMISRFFAVAMFLIALAALWKAHLGG